MTTETDSVTQSDPKKSADSDALQAPDRSQKEFDSAEMIEVLEMIKAPVEVIQAFNRLAKSIKTISSRDASNRETIKKERALRLNAESELETLRVKINHLELEIKDYELKSAVEEDKKYEGVEDAGEW